MNKQSIKFCIKIFSISALHVFDVNRHFFKKQKPIVMAYKHPS